MRRTTATLFRRRIEPGPRDLLFEYADDRLAVREIGIAAAIAAGGCRANAWHVTGRDQCAGGGQVAHQEIALGIDVGADMVGDGAGIAAEANAAIEVADPSHSGRPSSPAASVCQKRT